MFGRNERSPEDFSDEIRSHIELEADNLISEGMDPAEALRVARRKFGNVTSSQERFYESARWIWLENLVRDVRFALRQLASRPAFTLTAALTLALGIAASTAIFSAVQGVLLSPLPYSDPERLVQVRLVEPLNGSVMEYLTGLDYLDLEGLSNVFAEVACSYTYRETGFNLDLPEGPARVRSLEVSANFFETYGFAPAVGRAFTDADGMSADRSTILSNSLWRTRFDADPSVVGQMLRADGLGYKIVGVMQPGFDDAHSTGADLWIPHNKAPSERNQRDNYYLTVVAKLADGVSLTQAQEQVDSMRQRLVDEQAVRPGQSPQLVPLVEEVAGSSRPLLYALMAGAGLLLLVSCMNLGAMLLVRGCKRQHELALRAALGSSRSRLLRQLLTESATLAALGGAAGMLLGLAAVRGLTQIASEALPRLDNIAFDWRVLAAGLGFTALTALLFGWIPSWRASRIDLEGALRDSTRGGSSGVGQNRLHQALIVTQTALAVVVLIGAGLLAESFGALLRADLGFDPHNVLVFEVSLPQAEYPDGADRARFHQQLGERVSALPGVSAAGSTSWLPASGRYNTWGYKIPEEQEGANTDVRVVQGDYFGAMGIRLHQGRLFDRRDREESEPVVVISESIARRHWPDVNPIGKTLRLSGAERSVIGVVADTRYDHRVSASTKVYLPHEQFANNRNWPLLQVVSAQSDPSRLRAAIEAEVAALDPQLVVHHVRRLEDIVAGSIARERFAMLLMSAFGWTALLLAVIGIYGVLSYIVAQRTREIGIRVALGASRRGILGSVLGRALRLALWGALAGVAVAAFAARWLESLLYEIKPTDPTVFGSVIAATLVAAVLACIAPAARAAGVDPMHALRHE